MKSLSRTFAAVAAACFLSVAALAADVAGTWKFAGGGRGGRGGGGGGGGGGAPAAESTLVLEMKDGKLTGTLAMPGRGGQPASPVYISNGSIKDDVVTFTVTRNFNGNSMVTKYSGKLEGDTITGTMEGPGRDGGNMSRDWVAKRAR